MITFKEAFGHVAPPVHLQGTGFAAEPPPVDEEESDYTLKMKRASPAVIEDILRAGVTPADSGGLAGSDIERFEVWHKKISRLLGEFSYGEEA